MTRRVALLAIVVAIVLYVPISYAAPTVVPVFGFLPAPGQTHLKDSQAGIPICGEPDDRPGYLWRRKHGIFWKREAQVYTLACRMPDRPSPSNMGLKFQKP